MDRDKRVRRAFLNRGRGWGFGFRIQKEGRLQQHNRPFQIKAGEVEAGLCSSVRKPWPRLEIRYSFAPCSSGSAVEAAWDERRSRGWGLFLRSV